VPAGGASAGAAGSHENVSASPSSPIWTVPPCSSAPKRISSVRRSRTSRLNDRARGRAPVHGIVPLRREPDPRLGLQRDGDAPLAKLRLQLQDELLDDRLHDGGGQRLEAHDGVEPVAELRAENALDRFLRAQPGGFRARRAGRAGAEADRPALISREPALDVRITTTCRKSAFRPVLSVSVRDPSPAGDVVDVGMGLLDSSISTTA